MHLRSLVSLAGTLLFASCAGTRPANLGITATGFAPCPSSPNCVSSEATDESHAVHPFRLIVPAADGWRDAKAAVAALPRTKIVTETKDYLHAECSSALLGFVDDLELHLHVEDGTIAVRSASRLGYSDMGVNRGRVEELRSALQRAKAAGQ
jgi:uncharacterized protein (DUF1499 family)